MFVFSVKTDRKHLALGLTSFVAVVAAVVVAASAPKSGAVAGKPLDFKVTSAEERVALLHDLGHEVLLDSETVEEIRLPDDPDAALTTYEALQTPSGLSLLKHCGKRVKLYTYTVTNAQTDGTVWAHMYIYRDRVVAGDITAADPEGKQVPLITQ